MHKCMYTMIEKTVRNLYMYCTVYMFTSRYVHVCMHVCICMYVCMYVCMYNPHILSLEWFYNTYVHQTTVRN